MFILACVLIIMLTQVSTNKLLGIGSDNKLSYTYKNRDMYIILGFFVASIILHKVIPKGKIYWIVLGVYSIALLFTMVILGTLKRIVVLKQQKEILSIFEVLEPVIPTEFKIKDKETQVVSMRDPNNPPFKLEYEGTNVNKITIKINPNTFKEPVAVNLCLSLNKYLPSYEWVNEFDFAARECSFVGTPLPPGVARYQGSWLRPTEFIPIGLSGLGEVAWVINSFKNSGRSNYRYDDGKLAKTVDTPSAPQALAVGSPLGLDTIIPTTTGYKTMETIEVGDMIFDLNNNPVRVKEVHEIHESTVYELLFRNDMYETTVISDEIHRFPVVTDVKSTVHKNYFKPIQCKDLSVGDIIDGKRYSTLVKKTLLDTTKLVRCISVDSEDHIFLITDTKIDWNGGDHYIGPAICTYNTGGGKAIYIKQEVEVKDVGD